MKTIDTAFIPAAGLGLRLRPLTEKCPKPLLPINGRPLMTYVIDHLRTAGVKRLIVNNHHCPKSFQKAFPEGNWRGIPIVFRYEPVLLDTAGGLKNIEDLLSDDESLIVYNGDILSNMPLGKLVSAHARFGKEVTLALRSLGPLCNVSLDKKGEISDIRDLLGRPGTKKMLFSGIYIVNRTFFDRLKKGVTASVVPIFADMIRERPGSVANIVIDEGSWQDIGSIDEYERVTKSYGDGLGTD